MAAAAAADDGWVYPNKPTYQHWMISLMSFKHGRWANPYHKSTIFFKEELLALRPIDIKKWLTMRAFGTPNPNWETDKPDKERSVSLTKAKNGVSFLMPKKHASWIDGRGGNPTQHGMINKLIKDIEALETKGLGKAANDKQPYRQAEFDKLLEIFRDHPDFDNKETVIALCHSREL